MQRLPASDQRIAWFAPQPIRAVGETVRPERFPSDIGRLLLGRIGPLANLRSASGCYLSFATDSPRLIVELDRLRHHQPTPVGMDCEVAQADGSWLVSSSPDLREYDGQIDVAFATGCERGGPRRRVRLHLPLISTAVVAGLRLTDGAQIEATPMPAAQWLAIGDSITQGFSVQQPTQHWLHRLGTARDRPVWNLGLGGLTIDAAVFRWALEAHHWPLVTIGLGANHAWDPRQMDQVIPMAEELAQLVSAGGHSRVLWLLPPWRPCEEGLGPPDFAGVPLDRAAGERLGRVRDELRQLLADYPAIEVIADPLSHDARLYPDGLHPSAWGFAQLAAALDTRIGS